MATPQKLDLIINGRSTPRVDGPLSKRNGGIYSDFHFPGHCIRSNRVQRFAMG